MFTPSTPLMKYEVRDRVAWIHMNRPEAMNALSSELGQGISDCLDEADRDDDVLVAILIGEGGRAFSAGMDLKAMAASQAGSAPPPSGPGLAFGALSRFSKACIAAIDGYCLAGGMQMASRCDMRIATRRSKFGMPEARRALTAVGMEDTPELFVPAGEAMWILLTGGHMTAERAYDIGFIQQLVEDRDELIKAAEALAEEVKLCAPLAVRHIKNVVRTQYNMPGWSPDVKRLDAVRALTAEKRGSDVVVEAVGRPEAWEWAVQMVRKGGTVNFFGGCAAGTKVQLDTNRLHYSEITLKATFHHTPETVRRAFGLITERKVRGTDYITGEAPLSRLHDVLRHMLNRNGDIKTAIIPGH